MSSSLSNRSATGPSAGNRSRSHGKRSPARGDPSGRPDWSATAGSSVADAGLRNEAEREPRGSGASRAPGPRAIARAQHPADPVVRYDEREEAVGGVQQASATGSRSAAYESSSASRAPPHHQRELPAEVVGVLQAGVHALRADRAVDVRGIAEQETAARAEALGAAVMDAVGREPVAFVESEFGGRLRAQSRDHLLEGEVVAIAQLGRQDADQAPVILPAHREEQMKPLVKKKTLSSSATIGPVMVVSAMKNTCW